MVQLKQLLLILPFFLTIFSSCRKDEMLTDSSAKLEFSTDSVLFDTVFRYAGSTTKLFMIYNRHQQPMTISRAYLAGGSGSNYKLNIDGASTTASAPILRDIEILGGDSMYVFVQVHVTPSQSAPLLIRDSIIFETNGNTQDIKLTAIGQDVYLHKPNVFPTNGLPPYSITGREGFDTILPNDKPHLMFGYVVIDEDCKLTIQAGTKIYMHNKAVLWAYDKSTLNILGTKGNEVIIQGDRLEPDYKELPAQWGKIWLSAGSINNVIDWAIIKNGSIGIQADSVVVSSGNPTLKLSNTIVKNMAAAAIYGQGSDITGTNCVFANCGQYVAALTIGGTYLFEHCTFANYWADKRDTPSLVLNNYYVTAGNVAIVRGLNAYFGNCIVYGSVSEEVALDSLNTGSPGGAFAYKFDHCILRTGLNTTNGLHYNNVYKNVDPGFRDPSLNNYQLTSTAGAIDKGSTGIVIPLDLNNNPRPNPNTSIPDLGAYEYYP